jgi:hypothetical protein
MLMVWAQGINAGSESALRGGCMKDPREFGQELAHQSGWNKLVQYFVNFAVGSDARLNNTGATICAATGYIWPRVRAGHCAGDV